MFDFRETFKQLTGNEPFDWQERLFHKFLAGEFPDACDIPTGLGKTHVMTIWLIALGCWLKQSVRKIPLRLVYVVDRRVIVDQATAEAEKLEERLDEAINNTAHPLYDLAKTLQDASMKGAESILALSTLRGQKADNRAWCLDPSRPAIIIGTVDMIGSRLLFSGYGKVGINHRSLQAGLLGQDTLIVIDEAHLSPVFVGLLNDIQNTIQKTPTLRPFRMMSLSATLKGTGEPLQIDEQKECENETARLRLHAKKQIEWLPFDQLAKAKDAKKGASNKEINDAFVTCLVERAMRYEEATDTQPAPSIVIFVQTVELVNLIAEKLAEEIEKKELQGREPDKKELPELRNRITARILKMTGEMRGAERDGKELVENPKFRRFLPNNSERNASGPPHYLIATSCAEVGVNLDADHGVCDLATLDSMIQRIGRINRFGTPEERTSCITVVIDKQGINAFQSDLQQIELHQQEIAKLAFEVEEMQQGLEKAIKEEKKDLSKRISAKNKDKKALEKRGAKTELENIKRVDEKISHTWQALRSKADTSASPLALRGLLTAHQNALPEAPISPPFDEARIDDWAMTSLKQSEYPRPLVQYWLRGVMDDERATTTFVWRKDLNHFADAEKLTVDELIALATAIPIQPKERANLATYRAEPLLKALAGKFPDKSIVITDPGGESKVFTLQQIKDEKKLFELLAFATVILPCEIGGLDDDGNPLDKLPKDPDSVEDVVGKEWSRYLITRHTVDSFSIRPFDESDDGTSATNSFKSWQAAVRSIKDKGVCKNAEAIQKAFASKSDSNAETEEKKHFIAYFLDRRHLEDFTDENADDSASLNLSPRGVNDHNGDVEDYARRLAEKIGLSDEFGKILAAAGVRHDLGKNREWWQKAVGNLYEWHTNPIAKSKHNSFDHTFNQGYRHEFGSLVESLEDKSLNAHPHRDLILHLIASHHGYARPHFPDRAFDRRQPKPLNQEVAHKAMLRFNRLQRQYGWWQLAYLEAVLKAADALASRDYSEGKLGGEI